MLHAAVLLALVALMRWACAHAVLTCALTTAEIPSSVWQWQSVPQQLQVWVLQGQALAAWRSL